ncbi:MAG: tyrosine-type recombinase/integrase [Stellaceae bacterium]
MASTFPAVNGLRSRGVTLREIRTAATADHPWLGRFRSDLERADLAPATVEGYLKDIRLFLRWQAREDEFPTLSEGELIAYRPHLTGQCRLRPATVNRRLEALRRLCRWARAEGGLKDDIAGTVKPVRVERNRQPVGLTGTEVHGLLRAAGTSGHGHARRDYALVQLLVQSGLRVGEASALRLADVELRERTGNLRVRNGKGRKEREVPLNATARRALRQYLDQRPSAGPEASLFLSGRDTPLPIRSIQAIIGRLAARAHIERVPVSAHTLRHTFALSFLRANPGRLVELASLLGHDSLDTTALYTRPSADHLAADVERSPLNVDR